MQTREPQSCPVKKYELLDLCKITQRVTIHKHYLLKVLQFSYESSRWCTTGSLLLSIIRKFLPVKGFKEVCVRGCYCYIIVTTPLALINCHGKPGGASCGICCIEDPSTLPSPTYFWPGSIAFFFMIGVCKAVIIYFCFYCQCTALTENIFISDTHPVSSC